MHRLDLLQETKEEQGGDERGERPGTRERDKWWNWHDNDDAEASPHLKWVEVSAAGEAAFREGDAEAKQSP
jgi:hypothetical protein